MSENLKELTKIKKLMYKNLNIMTQEELKSIIATTESYRLELTVSTGNMDKFQEAICAFANDMPGKREKGYLMIGVRDDGTIGGMTIDDALMKKISGIRSQLASNLPEQVKSLILNIKDTKMTAAELLLAFSLSPKSKDHFKKHFIHPALDLRLLEMTHPDNPRHPQQKYYLTDLGLSVQKILEQESKQ